MPPSHNEPPPRPILRTGASSSRDSPNQSSLPLPSGPAKPRTEAEEEAAYWASYGVVQGTADSTIPSRVPSKGRLNAHRGVYEHDPYGGGQPDEEGGNRAWWDRRGDDEGGAEAGTEEQEDPEALYMSMRFNQLGLQPPLSSSTIQNNPVGPVEIPLPARHISPSPPVNLSVERERRKSEERDASDATALAKALFPVITYQEHLESLHGSDGSGAASPREPEPEPVHVPESSSDSTAAEDSPRVSKVLLSTSKEQRVDERDGAGDGAVSEAVRGIYKLWLAQTTPRVNEGDTASDSKAEFLALVAKAIA